MTLPRLPFREDTTFGILALAALVVPLVFTLNTYDNFEVVKYAAFLLLTGAALLSFILSGRPLAHRGLLTWTLVAFVVWSAVSAIFGLDWRFSVFGFYPRFTSSVIFFTTFMLYVELLLSVITPDKWRFLAKVLVFDAFAVAILGILQTYGIGYYGGIESINALQRAPSFVGNPNLSSMFVVTMMPFMVVFFRQAVSLKPRLYYALGLFASLASIAVFTSRGAVVGFIAIAIFGSFAALSLKRSRRAVLAWILVLVMGVVACLAMLEMVRPGSVTQTFRFDEQNLSTRLFAWNAAFKAIGRHPLVGVGPGNFQIFYEGVREKYMAGENMLFDDPHNLFLHLAAAGGLPFIALFLGFFALAGWGAARRVLAEKDELLAACLVAIGGFFIMAAFTPVFMANFISLAVLMVGIVPYAQSVSKPVRGLLVRLPLALLACVLFVWGIVTYASDVYFYRGIAAYLQENFEQAHKATTIATRLNPTNQLYEVYRIGSMVQLGYDPAEIRKDTERMVQMHAAYGVSYNRGANVLYLEFSKDRQREYFENAVGYLQKAIEKDPFNARRYAVMAVYYYDVSQFDTAKAYVTTSLELHNTQVFGWVLLAKLYQIEGQRSQMLFALEKAFLAQPSDTQLKQLLTIARNEPDLAKVPIGIFVQQGRLE